MKLSDALAKINPGSAEKTAGVVAPSAPAVAPAASSDIADRLKVALQEAIAPEAQKTAAQASPVEDLTKIAADLSASEHEALRKEAMAYGAAVCDGFMARAAQYNEAAAKVAAEQPAPKTAATVDTFDKFAAENPDLVKEAAQLGFDTTNVQLQKLAEAAYDKGWNDTVQKIHKLASDSFVAGFKAVIDIVEAAR